MLSRERADKSQRFPTVGEMLAHMENTKKVNKESHALFYTNLADDAKESLVIAAAWMTSQGKTFYSYQDAVDKDWMTQQLRWIGEDNPELFADRYARHGSVDALSIFSICYNQALAVAAINPDAYLFIRHDVEPEAMSTWSRVEYPFLTLVSHLKPRLWPYTNPTNRTRTSNESGELILDRQNKEEDPVSPM